MTKQIILIVLFSFTIISALKAQNRKLDSLLKVTRAEHADSTLAKNYYKIASIYLNKGQLDSCLIYTRKSFTLSKKINFLKGMAVSNNYFGQVSNYMGFADSAIYYFTASMNLYKDLKDTSRVAGMLNNLGVVYNSQGNISKALDYYFLSLKTKAQLHDSVGLANAFHNIAQLYIDSKDTVNSLKYHKLALEIRRKLHDRSGIGASLIAIGLAYKNSNRTDSAIQTIKEALKIAEDLGEEESIAIACYNLGSIYYDQGNIKECTALFHKSLELSRNNKNAKGIAVCLEALGMVQIKVNNSKEAVNLLEEAYKIGREIGAHDILFSISEKLSDAYEKTGEHKNALFYLKIANAVKDSLYNEENIRKLTSESLKYEYEKEKLLAEKELEKKEALTSAASFKKNLIIGVSILFLLVVSYFSYTLFKKLEENKRQKLIIEEQQKEMIASINYAKRIQYALLAHKDLLEQNLPKHFILFKPKDIVSGDFYWGTLKNNYFYLAVCDCTGHGVPGAFMSLLNINFLNEAINEKGIEAPGEILNHVREQLIKRLDGGRDGMDAILLKIPVSKKNNVPIEYAAANNSALLIRENQTSELSKDSMPVGLGEKTDSFKTFTLDVKVGDSLYLYTDGLADQFGGPKGKKFKYKQLDDILLKNAINTMDSQNNLLVDAFEQWRGNLEQVDDVCVLGIRF
ncbi:tetratricopeptide repeat protein [Aurantibacillus circumpalustris]|uniref:tetratricopeptide repeat protein n=1 Tax=Aurantibacillus circumpalustris TaxID=3036359 RepID=UPI00295B2966|nr:tetratricopeptide repeat protein [Aurantibacillus circumpalustris]